MTDAFDADPQLHPDSPPWFEAALGVPFEQRFVDVDDCPINYLYWGGPQRTDARNEGGDGGDGGDRGAADRGAADRGAGDGGVGDGGAGDGGAGDRGAGDRGAGGEAGLVFVHGGSAHAHWWTPIAATFDPWIRCVALDLSGHGDSGRRDRYDLDAWTDEVVAVAADAGIRQPVVIGHSMGGFVTVATAARHPESIGGAVIIDSPIIDEDPEIEAARREARSGRLRTYEHIDEAVARFRTMPPQRHYLDYVMDYVARRSLRRVDGGWQWKFDGNLWQSRIRSPREAALSYLGGVACRVALFRCEDGLVDLDIGRFMFDAMGRTTPVVELPTAGHHPMLDQPLVLITALRTLFADWIHSYPRRPVRAVR